MYIGIPGSVDELPCLGQADAGQGGEIVATGHDAHLPELSKAIVLQGALHHKRQLAALHQHSVAVQIHFEKYLKW